MDKPAVPVLMYHSIGIPYEKWQWNYLTIPYTLFEKHLYWMKKKGFHSIFLNDLFKYMKYGVELPKNPIVLTFDDGYLDNWVFAYPLLKKYNFKATIYISPEFVDPRNIIRKNLDYYWKKEIRLDELKITGFLSWNEMKEMEKSQIIDIQSHSMTHTWYPTSRKIIDFRHPGDSYIWMTWNKKPERKYLFQYDNHESIDYGSPVYEHGRSLGIKRYYPNEMLEDFLIKSLKKRDMNTFFKSNHWKKELYDLVSQFWKENESIGRKETQKEYENRIYYELHESKKIIEQRLNKEVKFLCWPGGAVTSESLRIAAEIGYLSSTVGKDMNPIRERLKNRFGEDPSRINRISSTLFWDGQEDRCSKIKYKNGFIMFLSLLIYKDNKAYSLFLRLVIYIITKIYKIIYLINN